jgi:mannitol/fructose-specific phosphotransferase system IIA component (Ntr-type)
VLNIVGAKESSQLQRVLVTILVGVLVFYGAQGVISIWGGQSAGSGAAGEFAPFFTEGTRGFLATIGIVFVSYAGLTKVASVAEEVKNPDRNIPLGMGLSLLTATSIYVLGVAIMVAVLPAADLHADLTPVYTSGEVFFNWLPYSLGPILIVVAAIAAFASTGNAGILSASRYPLAMARDRLLPDGFAKIGRFNTPTRSVVVTVGLMIVIIFLLSEEGVAKLASAFQLLIFALLNFAVIVMRESEIPSYAPGYRSPLYPWMQIAGIFIPGFLISEMGTLAIVFTAVVVLLGGGWYFYYASDVPREGAIFHLFSRLGRYRYDPLDRELQTILEEKGVEGETAFDRLVARAKVMHLDDPLPYSEVVDRVSDHFAEQYSISTETLRHGFLEGAPYSAVSVSHGAALPYCRLDGIDEPEMVMVHCRSGICVDLEDEIEDLDRSEPVYAFFFLVTPKADEGEHLRTLATLANRVDEEQFLVEWRAASNEQEAKESLLHHERYLTLHLLSGTNTEEFIDRRVSDLNLPGGVLVALVRRDEQIIVPSGPTTLQEGDRLTIIGSPAGIERLYELYRRGEQEGVVQ